MFLPQRLQKRRVGPEQMGDRTGAAQGSSCSSGGGRAVGPGIRVRVESRGAGGRVFLGSDSHSAVTAHSPAPCWAAGSLFKGG